MEFKSHPPFWYAGNPVHAGEYGSNFVCFSSVEDLPKVAARYPQSWQRQQAENDPMLPHTAQPLYGARTIFFLADTDQEAVDRARGAYQVYSGNYAKPVPAGAAPRPRPAGPRTIYSPGEANFDTARQWERLVVGSPLTAKEYVARYVAESTCNYLVTTFQWGDLAHQEAFRSMELFAAEVMPQFVEASVEAGGE